MKGATLFLLAALLGLNLARADRQLIIVIAPNGHSFNGTLQVYRLGPSGQWQSDDKPWPVLLGSHGLAWGKGLHSAQPGLQKREGDWRSPSGRFRIGLALGPEKSLPTGSHDWPYHPITDLDAWIDDPLLPHYNHLVTIKPDEPPPPWFERERMKPLDPAYHWCLLIEHNYPNSVPGAGSAIFFHIERGENVPTSGCVTMTSENIEKLLRWLDPEARPEFVLLTRAEYKRLWQDWKLPPLLLVSAFNR
jgi:L,D-peptidoglycan transpeptidase YkuD (ErfK/YbiS/YcfS/YnhG family)